MTRVEINALLAELGFYKKVQEEDEVPEEFRFSPAKSSPFPEDKAPPSETAADAEHPEL